MRGWAWASINFRGKIIIIYVISAMLFLLPEPLLNVSLVGVKLLLLLLLLRRFVCFICAVFRIFSSSFLFLQFLFECIFTGNNLLICSLYFWCAVFHRWLFSRYMNFVSVCVWNLLLDFLLFFFCMSSLLSGSFVSCFSFVRHQLC